MKNLWFYIAALIVLAPAAANAQNDSDYIFGTMNHYNPSVEIYSLDGPQRQIPQYIPPKPKPVIEAAPADIEADIESIEPEPETGWLGADWSGRVNFGASLQTGNSEEDAVNGDFTLKAKWDKKHRATLKGEFNRETDDGDITEDNRRLDGMYDYFFDEQWFLNTAASFEQDEIDEVDLRTTAGVGLGYQPYDRDDLHLQFVLGPTYLREDFENSDTEDSIAGRWAVDYDQKFFDDSLQAFHEHELLIPGDDTDGYLFDSKTGIRVPLEIGLVATAEVEFDWDNDPEPGIVEDDTKYSIKLGYEWD